MTIFPLPLSELFGHWGAYVVYLIVGLAFGYVLEIAGFGNSKKLAAQFYFKEQIVFKVMFTSIIVAMVLVFLASSIGLVDYNLLWVNPTYLWPGIVGGLIMGVGFIVGGFCPGTSLVAAATLKLDGIFFVLGVFFGIFLFGETVSYYDIFFNSSYMGRFTLPELLGLDTGVVVLLIVVVAILLFWGAEKLEGIFGDKEQLGESPKWRYTASGVLVILAVALVFMGQPTNADRWESIEAEKETLLADRAVQIHPAELLDLIHDRKIKVIMLDVRDEADFNLIHILDSEHVPLDQIPARIPELHFEPANTVFVTMSNDETLATEAWKVLVAESVPNVYILEGGVNGWIDTFADDDFKLEFEENVNSGGTLNYVFDAALGSGYLVCAPDPHAYEIEYIPKVKFEFKRAPTSGGCG